MQQVRTANNELLTLNDKPMGQGGEGGVYRILHPLSYRYSCVKIYANPKIELYKKLDFMIRNPPEFLGENLKICWPQNLVFDPYQTNKFLGFVMPVAFPASCQLQTLLVSGHRLDWSKKFDRNTRSGFRNTLALAKNIALTLYRIHLIGNKIHLGSGYVVGDLKPENIMVNEFSQVSLIDIDSIQINARQLFYPVTAYTPEYASPELIKISNNTPSQMASDNFSLAVILYRILIGIHPFMGTIRNKKGLPLQEAIAGGYYVHGRRKGDFEVIAPIHNRVIMLSKEVREFFRYALDDGLFNPSNRPAASAWAEMLHGELHSNRFVK